MTVHFAAFIGEQLPTVPAAVQREIVQALELAEASGASINQVGAELEAHLLGVPWRWPAEDDWRRRFSDAVAFPATWAGLETVPAEPPALAEVRGRWTALSVAARRLLAGRYWPMPTSELRHRSGISETDFDGVIGELVRAEFARRLRTPGERLELLRMGDLRAIAKAAGVKGSKRKADVLSNLRAAGDAQLEKVLPGELAGDAVAVDGFPAALTAWFDYERARILLLASSAFAVSAARRHRRDARESGRLIPGLRLEVLGQPGDPCPVCPDRAGRRVDPAGARPEDLPPFHPGCRCTSVPWHPTWGDAIADAKTENEEFLRRRQGKGKE